MLIWCVSLLIFPQPGFSSDQTLKLTRVFPTALQPSIKFKTALFASPLLYLSGPKPQIIIAAKDGTIAALDTETGEKNWQVNLSTPKNQQAVLIATPIIIEKKLVVLYQTQSQQGRESHRLVVIDLSKHDFDKNFPPLELNAFKPMADFTGWVKFSPAHAYSHSALKYASRPDSKWGFIYASFGNAGDLQPFHGWLFEIDFAAWRQQGSANAISSVLLTTPEKKCDVSITDGTREMICGGGIWTPAGLQIYKNADNFELLVPTGNGQLDLKRKDYANTLMRMGQGLNFNPECNEKLCANFNASQPSLACIQSCKNLFIPRPAPADKPLKPASGDCDNRTFWQCLSWMDYDLGANSPVKITLSSGHSIIVQAGKEGSLYLINANHLGTLYDRLQIVEICGTQIDPCKIHWRGSMVTQPVLSFVEDAPVVIFTTFISDETHPAGIIAVKIVNKNGTPAFKPFWQFPDPKSPAALTSFRSIPMLPVKSQLAEHGDIIWVVEIGISGTLYGLRIRDGQLIAKQSLLGTGSHLSRPIVYRNKIYIASRKHKSHDSWIEAYQIK